MVNKVFRSSILAVIASCYSGALGANVWAPVYGRKYMGARHWAQVGLGADGWARGGLGANGWAPMVGRRWLGARIWAHECGCLRLGARGMGAEHFGKFRLSFFVFQVNYRR